MTRPGPTHCALCGDPVAAPYRAPPPEAAPDLDLRPGEPTRSTLVRWLATCRGCDAVAPDLARLLPAAQTARDSAAYRALDQADPAMRPFLRWALLAPEAQRGEALLWAAWMAEDIGDTTLQRRLRAEAAAAFGAPASVADGLRLVDILRRAGAFADAAQLAARLPVDPADENGRLILAFQQARIAAGDAGRHLMSAALRPPTTRPHVAHGRATPPPRTGFWRRLFGGG